MKFLQNIAVFSVAPSAVLYLCISTGAYAQATTAFGALSYRPASDSPITCAMTMNIENALSIAADLTTNPLRDQTAYTIEDLETIYNFGMACAQSEDFYRHLDDARQCPFKNSMARAWFMKEHCTKGFLQSQEDAQKECDVKVDAEVTACTGRATNTFIAKLDKTHAAGVAKLQARADAAAYAKTIQARGALKYTCESIGRALTPTSPPENFVAVAKLFGRPVADVTQADLQVALDAANECQSKNALPRPYNLTQLPAQFLSMETQRGQAIALESRMAQEAAERSARDKEYAEGEVKKARYDACRNTPASILWSAANVVELGVNEQRLGQSMIDQDKANEKVSGVINLAARHRGGNLILEGQQIATNAFPAYKQAGGKAAKAEDVVAGADPCE